MVDDDPNALPDWCAKGAKFRLHDRLYHVHGVVDGIAVLKEWWKSKQRWNYTAETPIHFWVSRRYIKVLKKGSE